MLNNGFWIKNWEKVTGFAFGTIFIGVLLFIAFLVPAPTVTQWFVCRVVLAIAAAGIASIIPGLIAVKISAVVRAGGAIAVFVVVYWFNPPRLVSTENPEVSIHQTTGGESSPAVVASGDVTVAAETKEQNEDKKKR